MFAALPIPQCECKPCGTYDACDDRCTECYTSPCTCTPCCTTPVNECADNVVNLDTVADMAAYVPYDQLRQFNLQGQFTAGDGQGGIWEYNKTSTATDDGYWVVTPPAGTGRYLKVV